MTAQEREHTKASFLAMIRADPRNKDNRLIFADWCEENNELAIAKMLRRSPSTWLRDFARKFRTDYDEMISDITNGDVHCFGSDIQALKRNEKGEYIRRADGGYEWIDHTDTPEFWLAVELVTGVTKEKQESGFGGFRCAC